MIDKDIFAYNRKSAKVGEKGREYGGGFMYRLADDITQDGPCMLNVPGLVELADKEKSPVYDLIDLEMFWIVQSDWLPVFQSFKNISRGINWIGHSY
jgi:hypothetical protein